MERPFRVAIVGAGPSGMYAADALASASGLSFDVDVLDKLPVPFGLVRYGVAPDHLSIRSVRDTLDAVLDRPNVRFVGNVEVGLDMSVSDLHRFYDAIIWTYGASADRRLLIPGEELPGSVAATDLVAWYTGHPDAHRAVFDDLVSTSHAAVVIGVGNVAIDVARILAKTPVELQHTDMPQHVLEALAASSITDIHVLGRRGAAQASFTTKELRELGELADADVVVAESDLTLDDASNELIANDKAVARNVAVLTEWAAREPQGKPRRIFLHFLARPVAIEGTRRVEQVIVERTELDGKGQATGTGTTFTIKADLVVRSVGYRGTPLGEVPFDDKAAIVVSEDGRVREREYVAGWIKRGPTGIIGTNKKCAVSTVASLIEDAMSGVHPRALEPTHEDVDSFLRARGIASVTSSGWRSIDAAERELGRSLGRDRTTIHDRDDLLRAALLVTE